MVDYKYKDLYWKSHIDKQLKITTDDGSVTFTNKNINWEDFELTESLCCEQQLKFGLCESSVLKFKISNSFIPLTGKWLIITETLDQNTDEPFQYGRYKVFSDVPTADKKYRDITAYDAMYDILETDMTQWYNNILPNKNIKLTLKQFRTNFISYFHLQQQDITLINDNMIIERTLEPEQISGKDVITAICEINGCFGHIGRDGKFHYIYLPQGIQGLYPSNTLYPDHAPNWLIQSETGHLYPQDPKSTKLGGVYISCKYEDFLCKKIDKIQIKQQENDIGCIYGNGDNSYLIVDNFLVYGKGSEELQEISRNIFDKITNIIYRPFSAECVGNPCLEVGDPIRLSTKYELIESYILKRTLKGIQGLRDIYEALGEEYRTEKMNSVQKSIIQLKGKSNTLTRTIEETKSEITAFEKNVENNYSTTTEMNTAIIQSADKINLSVDKKISETKEYADGKVEKSEETLNSKIEQTAESITLTVAKSTSKYDSGDIIIKYYGYGEPENKEYLSNAPLCSYYLDQSNGDYYVKLDNEWQKRGTFKLITTELNSKIDQTADSITSTVAKSTSKYDTGKIEIDYYGYGEPDKNEKLNNVAYASSYLDQSNGKYYQYTRDGWQYFLTFELITTELNSKIDQTADSITSTVAKSTSKYDTGKIEIDYYGYGEPDKNEKLNNVAYASSYLDQSNGKYYQYTRDGWQYFLTFELITTELNSKIDQNAGEIVMKVNSKDKIVQVKLGVNPDDESATIFSVKSGNIELSADEVINLMAGGTINLSAGNGISIDSPNFKVDTGGNVQANNATLKSAIIDGEITAKSGKIGNFDLSEHGWMEYNQGDNHVCGMGAQAAFYAGSGTSLSAPFHVTYDGQLYATGVNISGNVSGNLSGYMSGTVNMSDGSVTGGTIGSAESGWNVAGNGLSNGNSIMSPDQIAVYRGREGVDKYLVVEFKRAGYVRIDTGKKGTIQLNGIDFTYDDFYRLKTEILGGTVEENNSINIQRSKKEDG